ncbi:hypothetical protein AFK68_18595 [Hydrocoleum sp. CS-953]|nr:hypothetical protein AFK68_18595 [Hydrocoleum sp. CS-953]
MSRGVGDFRDVLLRKMFAEHSGTENAVLLCNVRAIEENIRIINIKLAKISKKNHSDCIEKLITEVSPK